MEIDFKELKTLDELEKIVQEEKRKGNRIVFTNGCFDILHKGHRYILTEAAKYGEILIVALNSDKSVRKFKGEGRPTNKELDRAYVVSGFGVDYVIIFDEDKPLNLLRRLQPDIVIKGGAGIPERVEEEKQIIESYGGKLITLPLVEGYSTTGMIAKIKNSG